jgi:hypothetical protein
MILVPEFFLTMVIVENNKILRSLLNLEGTEKLNVFQVRLSTKQKIVNEAEAFSFINYFYLVIYIITRIFLS